MKIKDFMRKDVSTVDEDATISEASKVMLTDGVGYLVVLAKGKPVGLISERDIVYRVLGKDLSPSGSKVKDAMTSPPVTIDPDASIDDAVDVMVKKKVRRLPVVKGGIIYGIFTSRDLVDHFSDFEDIITKDIVRGAFFLSSYG